MTEKVKVKLELETTYPEVLRNPLAALSEIFQRELVDRLKLGADYGNIQDNNGNKVGTWNIFLDD